MRPTPATPHSAASDPAPSGFLIVAALMVFWTVLLVVNLVSLPVRLVRRLLHH